MSLIDFIKKHEKVLSTDRDSHRQKLALLKTRLDELQSMQPDYQEIANEICAKLEKEQLLPDFDRKKIEVGDEVIGVGKYGRKVVDGLRGRVVEITNYIGDVSFGVEWERDIGGHTCDGKAKRGHGWYEEEKTLKRIAKPEIKSKDDYESFLEDVIEKAGRMEDEEYLNYSDKDFKKGDEVITTVEFPTVDKGTKGVISRKIEGRDLYCLDTVKGGRYFSPNSLAKVKRRGRKIKVGDKVEVVNSWLGQYKAPAGSYGVVKRFGWAKKLVMFEYVRNEDLDLPVSIWINNENLQLKDKDQNLKKAEQIIQSIESKNSLPEYRQQIGKLAADFSELVKDEKIPIEEIKVFLDVIADLEIDYSNLGEDELEDLLQ